MTSFAQIKRDARRAVHETFAVAATFQDDTMTDPVDLRVRFHSSRVNMIGDLGGQGYAEVESRIDKIIFDVEALAALPVVPCRGATITIPDYGLTLVLEQKEPSSGPINETWTVTRA